MDWGSREGEKYDMWADLVSEIFCIHGRDYPFPGEANRSRVRFRPVLQSSGYKRPGFKVWGLFRQTSISSEFKIDFFSKYGMPENFAPVHADIKSKTNSGCQSKSKDERRDIPAPAR
jgi:hypothetical protein